MNTTSRLRGTRSRPIAALPRTCGTPASEAEIAAAEELETAALAQLVERVLALPGPDPETARDHVVATVVNAGAVPSDVLETRSIS